MKFMAINKKKIIELFFIFFIFILIILKVTNSFAMQNYYKLDFSTGMVTATTLNVRSGPGIFYNIIATVKKNEYIHVFAGVGDWYVVQIEGDYIGAVNKKYIKPIYPSTNSNTSRNNTSTNTSNQMTDDEKEVFNLINQERAKNGLPNLEFDSEIQNVARIKAQDLVTNNYFAHESPIYGSPFQMLSNFKVTYKTAGENLAGNSSNSAAVTAWMNSSGHRANILNSSFKYTGIGVVNSNKYGKVYVQMFVGR